MFILDAYAQSTNTSTSSTFESLQQFLPLILIFVVFYFLLIRPQQKKTKAHRELISQLRRGDRVLIQSGIIGQINKVINDTEVLVEIADDVRVRVVRSAISEVLAKTESVSDSNKESKIKDEISDDNIVETSKIKKKKLSVFSRISDKK
ncbi:MAG: preprotein translocase subunit YajC [Rhodospirillaceae bacterium]|jgi:preprotein translocase subunit YajC|nr:preprotein translocase subunit YajC [Rhodospirillaceae bacterium]